MEKRRIVSIVATFFGVAYMLIELALRRSVGIALVATTGFLLIFFIGIWISKKIQRWHEQKDDPKRFFPKL
jgi:hypothetical protein